MKARSILCALCILAISTAAAHAASDPASVVPSQAPRTLVLAGRAEAFRAYCTTGEGAKAFAKIRADFDREFASYHVPAEPVTYGDPSPSKRTSAALGSSSSSSHRMFQRPRVIGTKPSGGRRGAFRVAISTVCAGARSAAETAPP